MYEEIEIQRDYIAFPRSHNLGAAETELKPRPADSWPFHYSALLPQQ